MPPSRLPRAPFSPATVSDLEAMFRRMAADAVEEAMRRQRAILAGIVSGGTLTGVTNAADILTDSDGNVLTDDGGNVLTQ